MRHPDTLYSVMESKWKENNCQGSFYLELPNSIAQSYNAEFEHIKADLRKLHPTTPNAIKGKFFDYKATVLLLLGIRLACVVTAWYGSVCGTLIVGLLQFFVAPYSFFASAALAISLAPFIYGIHYITFGMLQSTVSIIFSLLPASILSIFTSYISPYLYLPIGPRFIALFFFLDQLICLYIQFCTPSKNSTVKETLAHIVWGFLNTKTCILVILLHMMNAEQSIPIGIWLVDGYFQIGFTLADAVWKRWMHPSTIFYHQHRMVHLPSVYEHAHKLHHYLHGSQSFDAHNYGYGMPEEYFLTALELLVGISCGQMPAMLNLLLLLAGAVNKYNHTQKPEDTCGENFHTDHHLLHVKNFGIFNCLMDMYFSTSNLNEGYVTKPSGKANAKQNQETSAITFHVEKKCTNEMTTFCFTPKW